MKNKNIQLHALVLFCVFHFCRIAAPNPAYSFLNTIRYSFSDDVTIKAISICMDHDHELLKPQVISTWMPNAVGSTANKRVIFAETQVSTKSTN